MILFFDDERENNIEYITELKSSGYNVEYRKDVSVAFNFLKEHLQDTEMLILDIMMSHGTFFKDEETNGGLRTGIRFYELVRQITPDLPVLILTNVSDSNIQERFDKEKCCRFVRKEKCYPFELAEQVTKFLSEIQTNAQSEDKSP